ncbi:MAG: GAF domain-containing protein [Chloroflexota bacterium]|nr:GAF domain-containing protein [Chloroflexota bacterium]
MTGHHSLSDMLTLRQAASLLGVQPQTLRRWESEGKLSARRTGPRGLRRYARRDVQRLLQSQDVRVRNAQQVVVEVARAISGSLDLHAVAKTVVEAAVRVVGSDRCAIYLVSADRTTIEPLWGTDVTDPASAERLFFPNPIPIDALPLVRHALQQPQPLVIDDTETHPLSNPELFRFFETRTVINVGLRGTDGEVFAVMPFLWTGQPHFVRDDDVFLAQSLAALAEVALSNARLFEEIEQERQRATIINDVVHDVHGGRDLGDTLTRAIKSLVQQLHADEGAIFLIDPQGTSIVGAAETHTHSAGRVGVVAPLQSVPLVARVVEHQRPRLVTIQETEGNERQWFESLQIQSSLYVPLLAQGKLVGIAFANYRNRTPHLKARDTLFADALAAQCALAMERVQLLESASARAAELEAVIAQMQEGVIIADRDGRIVLVNEYAAQLHGTAKLGVAPDDYSEAYHLSRLDGTPYPPLELPLSRAVLQGETVSNAEWRITLADGSEVIASGSATPLAGADGTRLGAVLVVRDVTARRKLEAEKDQFLSVVSHELRTPLTTIKGLTELAVRRIDRGVNPAAVLGSLHNVSKQVRRMEGLIGDLLDIRRLETGTLPLDCQVHDLWPLVEEARDRAQAITDRHTIEAQLDAMKPLRVYVDKGRLDQVFDNILSNAIKYSPDGGMIVLMLSRNDDQAVLRISDQGIGIPEQGREQLFERFYRGANVPPSEYGGLGIGLALSREIVQRHSGTLILEGTSPRGSTFQLCLPLV